MKNIFRKSLFIVIGCLMASTVWGQDKIFSFSEASALDDWTFTIENPKNGTAKYEILSSHQGISAKDGSFLALSFMNQSLIKITLTSKETFQNISHIYYDVCSTDNSKPDFTLNIVDDDGNVIKNIYSNKATKNDFGSSGTKVWGASDTDVTPASSGHVQISVYASSSGKYAAIDNIKVTYSSGPSDDATLKSLTIDGNDVAGFDPKETDYYAEYDCNIKKLPDVKGVPNHEKANAVTTPVEGIPGTAIVTVTAEDGNTKLEYKVHFTCEGTPIVESATWDNIKGEAIIDQVNKTIVGQVKHGSSLNLLPKFTGKNLDGFNPPGKRDFSKEPANTIEYVFTSLKGQSTTYLVTITEGAAASSDATLKSLKYDDKDVPGLAADKLSYEIELPSGSTTVPTVVATANDANAKVTVTPAANLPGETKIEVVAEDATKKVYTISFTVAIPSTTLTIHTPDIYADPLGYNTPLVSKNGRIYEVYYFGKAKPAGASSDIAVAYTKNTLSGYLVTKEDGGSKSIEAKDGWFSGSLYNVEGSFKEDGKSWSPKASKMEEFEDMPGDIQFQGASKKESTAKISFHISGYDQFSFVGYDADVAGKEKMFIVRIDGVQQTFKIEKANTIRRFDLTPTEHLIEISSYNSSTCKFFAFSLREANTPRVKHIDGDDESMIVRATDEMEPIYYFTKFNSSGETRLVWDVTEATGITLSTVAQGELGDTLKLSGHANCPAGTYKYFIKTYYEGKETSSVKGKFQVITDITTVTDTILEAYSGEPMEELTVRYYASDASAIHVTWKDSKSPEGITTTSDPSTHTYTLSGVLKGSGKYRYTITIDGNTETRITGTIDVVSQELGVDPILYLYRTKTPRAYTDDGVYNHLKSAKYNIVARTTLDKSKRDVNFYKQFKAIIISEDVNANNSEVLDILQNKSANLPILNMKNFTYAYVQDGKWGVPDNGTKDTTEHHSGSIFIQRTEHPIFKDFKEIGTGDEMKILDAAQLEKAGINGVMPIAVTFDETYCLATAFTRSLDKELDPLEAYYTDGERQTFIHEIPMSVRGQKYICFPISHKSSKYLTADGKKLVEGIMSYLLSPKEAEIEAASMRIKNFRIGDKEAEIDQKHNSIVLSLTENEFTEMDSLRHAHPEIELAEPYMTYVTPTLKKDETINLETSLYLPYVFAVSDYISRREYEFSITLRAEQGLENVYTIGEWVHIYDIYGRKVATTNENIYTMSLPRGIYIAVTAGGQTIKLLR